MRLCQMSQHILRVECRRCSRTVEIQKVDAIRLYGSELATSFIDRPSLIGGMRIQVGSDVYDGTVQSELAALEKSF